MVSVLKGGDGLRLKDLCRDLFGREGSGMLSLI
jgi:hypothetical protein